MKSKRPSSSKSFSSRPASSRNASQFPARGQQGRKPFSKSPQNSHLETRAPRRSEAQSVDQAEGSRFPRTWRLVGGTHAIREAMKIHPKQSKVLLLRDDFEASDELREMKQVAEKIKVQIQLKNKNSLDKTFTSHQGALLFVDGNPVYKEQETEKSIVLFLDGLEDPHNLGAILRTAWLVGVEKVVIPQDRSVGLTPTVHKIASGGVEHVPVISTSDFTGEIQSLKDKGYWVFGLEGTSTKSLYSLKLPQKVVWIVGSEERGMRKGTSKLCDELVHLPQVTADASYNASVALGMTLAETQRQFLLL